MELMKHSFGVWFLILLPFMSFSPLSGVSSWMSLGIASVTTVTNLETCRNVPGLVFKQMELCKNNPQSIWCVSEGARRAIHECQSQFRFERWNCTINNNQSVFGEVLSLATKETAFIYAVLSAGVLHAVTESCSAGNLSDCSCDMTKQGSHRDGWKWGGCSDNVNYGIWFSKNFVDAPETIRHQSTRDIKNLINLHNNEVGRMAIEANMHLKCRCHGVSGSCAVKTCWKSMPSFEQVGQMLKQKYISAVAVAPRSRRKLRRRVRHGPNRSVDNDELVFLNRSPNYCRPDPENGILGTTGRICNRTTHGVESCKLLCCGRGYNTQIVRIVERCQCKFHWCCYVSCKTCETFLDIHTCK